MQTDLVSVSELACCRGSSTKSCMYLPLNSQTTVIDILRDFKYNGIKQGNRNALLRTNPRVDGLGEPWMLTVPRGQQVQTKLEVQPDAEAPVVKGAVIGKAIATSNGK